MFKWLFHILIFATNDGSGKYQNKEKPLTRQRKLRLQTFVQKYMSKIGLNQMFNALFYLYSHFIDVTCIPVRANVQIQHLNPENRDSIYPTH